ncbi:SUKH-4 family immunity protein [Streptomyces djakartensis]|uniref:Nucleic acid/nucleotide deaminase of polymorphic system toxin n=1 Tax=Streptomyces djakartensis TaxID=68193 RepID=A0ABQ2ZSL1_9ACTN|nr:SUKH-4 family immunity protein [Streptomyces djakartensis]GGY23069.1 hypothetical protein GCM10010384_32690 [Streptomyces djakartensis]
MVTFAQAQERAEEWVNGDLPSYQHREVRVREFELGFVVWAEDRAGGPRSDGGAQRLVIARDSGEATLWPGLPVGEVIRRYEEEYGRPDVVEEPGPVPAARVDLNQTSFLLTPPEWLQDAADRMGVPDRRGGGAGAAAESDGGSAGDSVSGSGASWPAAAGSDSRADGGGGEETPGVPAGATPWAGTDTNADAGDDRSVPLPATVFAPPLGEADDGTPAPAATPGAETALMPGGSGLPPTAVSPAIEDPDEQGGVPGGAGAAGAPGDAVPMPGAVPTASGGPGYGCPPGPGAAPGGPGTPPGGVPGVPPGSAPGVPSGVPEAPHGGVPGAVPGAPPGGVPEAPHGGVPGAPPGGVQGALPGAAPGTPPGGVPGSTAGAQPGGVSGGGTPSSAPGGQPYGYPQAGPGGMPGRAPNAGDIADAATSKAAPPPGRRGAAAAMPPPPGAPGTPGVRPGSPPPPSGSGAPGTPAGGYEPTQLVSALGPEGPVGPGGAGPGGAGGPGGVGAPGAAGDSSGSGSARGTGMPMPPQQPPARPGVPMPPQQPPGPPAASQPPGAPPAQGAAHAPGAPGVTPPGGVHHAGTMFAGSGRPGAGAPPPPGPPGAPGASRSQGAPHPPAAAPGVPGGGAGPVHHAETVLSTPPVGGPGVPPPPQAPGVPGAPLPGAHGGPPPMPPGAVPGAVPPGAMPPPGQPAPGRPPAYGYPQQPAGQPTVGPGYQAVLRYRAQDGSEQQLIRRSAPGTPHPEWQIFHELRAMNVPPDQVLELHTELESCELPGAYCARMIREQWPQARITSIAPYGTDHASRQQGMRQLLAHQGELHQVADGPARPAPVRAPLPPVQAVPPIPPEGVAQEMGAAFGPGVFRFEQAAVSRQGVPPVVAHTLVVAGLPVDMGPFFWAQAQPGRPVPTLAELAAERGVQPAPDAGSYLVMGSDFGKAVCVQYGTANIVAVPVEAGPGGAPVPPQFVNTGLPEFARCLALLGRMWRLRFGLNQEQAGRWTVDFQAQLAALDPAALGSPESWWSVLLEQMWDGLL